MRPGAEVHAGAAVVPLRVAGRRNHAALEEAFAAMLVAVRDQRDELEKRPRQLAELDRSVARLYQVVFVGVPGQVAVLSLLERHERKIDELEARLDELAKARLRGAA